VIALSLQSGSNGNCIYVEAGNVSLLFDAGISGKQASRRLKARGRDPHQCRALIISHDHGDHIRCAGVYQRKFGLPIYATEPALARVAYRMGHLSEVRHFKPGDELAFGQVRVETVPTPHDVVDGVAFVVEHAGKRLGILTDLGHPFEGLGPLLSELDGVFLESNYDPDMLEKGAYPPALKARIRGPGGHLSNIEAARLVADHAGDRLQWVALAHLSENNNTPRLAVNTHRRHVGNGRAIQAMSRYEVGPILEV